ncbi:MAG: hypothetical protein ABIQ40_07395 [Bacteroidia bacterium]
MNNIENNTHTDGVRGFLKEWVKQWVTTQTVNTYSIAPRVFAMDNLIRPWLRKANNNANLTVDLSNWEGIWNGTTESALQNNAPFKLTAIVNRIDLRGNAAYTPSISNAGETRFIFTLINPYTGIIPINPNQTASMEQNGVGFVDWRGMNVIFEYGNPQTTLCLLKTFAQQWLNLSDVSYSFGTAASNNSYKDALQLITDQVTNANSVPSKTNGSAINRIRTNEKAFATFGTNPNAHVNWELQDWEFRQFELGATTHKLAMAPLTNNPPHTANYAPNILEDYTSTSQTVTNNNIFNWIFSGHKFQVLHGNFNLPTNLLSGSGIVRREETQFFGFLPNDFATAGGYNPAILSSEAKAIRQQLSLNTCSGCHAGETKTVFTHVNPVAYAEPAKYWLSSVDGATNITQDDNLYPSGNISDPLQAGGKNIGETYDGFLASYVINFETNKEMRIYDAASQSYYYRNHFQSVSPFLTGRRYEILNSTLTGYPNWQDDEPDDGNATQANHEEPDNTMLGLFYVNDPSNDANTTFPFLQEQKWGFNDLQRRHDDLCQLLNANCDGTTPQSILNLMILTQMNPFPIGAH